MGSRSYPRASAALVGLFVLLIVLPGRAAADVCVTVDEALDTFTPQERAAAVLLLERQFELAGEHIVPPGCASSYVVSHVQLGNTITVTLSGAQGQRDAVARGIDDVPAIRRAAAFKVSSRPAMNSGERVPFACSSRQTPGFPFTN